MKVDDIVLANIQKIRLNKRLPKELVVGDIGDHLYMIGATFQKNHANSHRYKLHHPILFLFYIIAFFCRSVTILTMTDSDPEIFVWMGDLSNIIHLQTHFNVLLITFDYIIVFLLAINYLLYKRTKEDRSLLVLNKPFDLVAGLVTPKSIGFYDPRKVVIYAGFVKVSVSALHVLIRYGLNIPIAITFYMVTLIRLVKMNSTLAYFVAVGQTLIFTVKAHIFYTFLLYHMFYFYIICFYLRIKIDTIQNLITRQGQGENRSKLQNAIQIRLIVMALKDMYTEIGRFNTQFWSFFFFCVWGGFSVNISTFLYTIFYADIDIMIRVVCSAVLIIEMFTLVSLWVMASSVNKKARILFKMINSSNLNRCKVNLHLKLQLSLWMELWSGRIGFTCWKMFNVNYFTFYEFVAVNATFFLKLIQLKNQL